MTTPDRSSFSSRISGRRIQIWKQVNACNGSFDDPPPPKKKRKKEERGKRVAHSLKQWQKIRRQKNLDFHCHANFLLSFTWWISHLLIRGTKNQIFQVHRILQYPWISHRIVWNISVFPQIFVHRKVRKWPTIPTSVTQKKQEKTPRNWESFKKIPNHKIEKYWKHDAGTHAHTFRVWTHRVRWDILCSHQVRQDAVLCVGNVVCISDAEMDQWSIPGSATQTTALGKSSLTHKMWTDPKRPCRQKLESVSWPYNVVIKSWIRAGEGHIQEWIAPRPAFLVFFSGKRRGFPTNLEKTVLWAWSWGMDDCLPGLFRGDKNCHECFFLQNFTGVNFTGADLWLHVFESNR